MPNALVEYLTAACSGTGQATFYNTKGDQTKALNDAHTRMMVDNRRRYALSIAFPITDKSRQLILTNLLGSGSLCEDGALETAVIEMAVKELPFNRVLNMFVGLRTNKINNSRTRRLGRAIWHRVDAYQAIKYAGKLRTLLRHCHIPEGSNPARAELHKWLYGANKKRGRSEMTPDDVRYNDKLLSRLKAPHELAECYNLPYDIGEAIAIAHHDVKLEEFRKYFAGAEGVEAKGAVTRKESMRARRATSGTTAIDFKRFSIFDLLVHGYRTESDIPAILPVIGEKARNIAQSLNMPGEVALVIDNSVSTLGSGERQFHPIAMIGAIEHIIYATESRVKSFYTGDTPENGMLRASGTTNLRKPLVDALMIRPDIVFIVSDGYENVRAGSVSQIVSTKAVKDLDIPIIHLNPVASAEASGGIRTLSPLIKTFAVGAPDQLPMITLIGLASQDPRLLEPMFEEVEKHIKSGDFKSAKLATRMAGLPARA